MDPKALIKAQSRLRVASKNAAELKSCKTYGEFSDTWYVFLHAAKGIYTTLEQGAKATPQARQWFGAKNNERKGDPLLRYVTEARNDDEHGIEPITEYVPGSVIVGAQTPGASTEMTDEFGNVFRNMSIGAYRIDDEAIPLPRMKSLDGKPVAVRAKPPTAKLVTVRDRSGNPFDPPQSHLGNPIPEPTPLAVAELTVSYLEKLVAEAEGFHTP